MGRDSSKSWIEDFDFFKEQLKRGRRFQRIIEKKLRKAGVKNVEVPENGFEGVRDREDLASIKGYTKNNNDIYVAGRLFELKSRNIEFENPQDFPYNTIIVDTTSSAQKAEKPVGYIFISTITRRLIALSRRESRKSWTKEYLFDRDRKIYDWFYLCPRSFLHNEETLVDTLLSLKRKKLLVR